MPSQGQKGRVKSTTLPRRSEPGSLAPKTPKANVSDGSKSAGNSPASSPQLSSRVLSRQTLGPKTDSTVVSTLNDTVIIDPVSVEEPLEKTTVLSTTKTVNTITQCPCGMFDRKCLGMKCSSCNKEWHSECCNLTGVTPSVAKKLEVQMWKCPWCYEPGIKKPGTQSETQPSEVINKFTCSITRLEAFTEKLNDNITSVEFYNEHIRHLLLDDAKFKLHSEKIDKLSTDVDSIKEDIKKLLTTGDSKESDDSNLSQGMMEVRSQMEILMQRPLPNFQEELHESINKISIASTNEINELKDLIKKAASTVRDNESTSLRSINQELSDLRQQVEALVSRPQSDFSQELGESIKKMSTIPIDDICRIGSSVDAFSEKVTQMQTSLSSIHEASSAAQAPTVSTIVSPRRMQPNTTSPHSHRNSSHVCSPFTLYEDKVISQELKEELQSLVEDMDDSFETIGTENSRDVSYFGKYNYRYSGGEHTAKPLPDEITKLIESIRPKLPDPAIPINSCLVSRYVNGSNMIPPHRDNEITIDPDSDIITISIGAERAMTFTNNSGDETQHQVLKDCSMLVSSRFAQDFWLHSIEPCSTDEVRYSFTLRHIAPHFINSTIILGDSNTVNVKFGEGEGTLGAWMPGKRVKVGHIEALPSAEEIGPYRNIVIHTGINSINCSQKYKTSNRSLIDTLEYKLRNICDTYPRARVYISLLLPTRLASLNYKVRDFNKLIMDMTCRLSRLNIIEHSCLGDVLSNEHGRWKPSGEGPNVYVPRFEDCVHLGKIGIRMLAKNIKQYVIGRSKSQSEARFSGGQGSYNSALVRGRQGYSSN